MMKNIIFLIVGVVIICPMLQAQESSLTSDLNIYPGNPFYWEYMGQPVFLIGASSNDNLFQSSDLENELDLLVSYGGNYLRCTMSSRDAGDAKPYLKENGLFNLDKPNPEFWQKFEKFLQMTSDKNIIIQVEIWATYDFYHSASGWAENVFNPLKNSNYNVDNSDLPSEINHTAQYKINPFFETVPAIDNNEIVLAYQKKFVDKILSHTFKYGNVLYCIDNETNAHPDWGEYWALYLRQKAGDSNKRIFITEMWDNWDPTGGMVEGVRQQEPETHPFLGRSKVKNTIHSPQLYDFVDISNNNAQNGEIHYLSALYVRNWIKKTGIIRPINNVKIYGGTIYTPYTRDWAGSYKDGEERFWRDAFAGHASIRFHRPPYGHGISSVARHHVKSMRMLTDSMDFFQHEPSNNLISERDTNEAFCLAIPGMEYAVYFPGQGRVQLNAKPGLYEMNWLHIRSSTWRDPIPVENPTLIQTPDNDQWVVLMKRNKTNYNK